MQKIKKLLIANRGEIAVRIISSAKKSGIKTVVIYAAEDAQSLYVKLADEAFLLDGDELKDTYLNVDKIINVAIQTQCDALHPGYGFLAESEQLVNSCAGNGIIFVGPHADAIRLMGNKIESRKFVKEIGIPMTEGVTGSPDELLKKVSQLKFPVLIKAAAGGGGKGMRIVYDPKDLEETLQSTAREAKSYFGDGTVYIEKYIEEPRHIEIQVLGDNNGNVIHLFERECSIQRRYQKIIEESPSPTINNDLRKRMGEAAVNIAKKVKYNSAGTVEFLVDKDLEFYFLEMNTRIQVEHPVTEMVTGIDIVEEQLRVAEGSVLSFKQEEIKQTGHAIECRIYAEDPENDFIPSPGKMTFYKAPKGEGIRIDSGIDKAAEVPSNFDPMISKLIVWSPNRLSAISKTEQALENYIIQGVKTNIPYLLYLLKHPYFIENKISTGFCDLHTEEIISRIYKAKDENGSRLALSAMCLYILHLNKIQKASNIWKYIGFWRPVIRLSLKLDDKEFELLVTQTAKNTFELYCKDENIQLSITDISENKVKFSIANKLFNAFISADNNGKYYITINGLNYELERLDQLIDTGNPIDMEQGTGDKHLYSPMPGKVIKVNVKSGDKVQRGTILLVVESMKMENNIVALNEATVEKVNVTEGERVNTDLLLVNLKEIESE